MNRMEHLLACLGEECGEAQQEVGKCLRFGHNTTNGKTGGINLMNLKREVNDIVAMFYMVMEEAELYPKLDAAGIKRKQEKVEAFFIEE
jgi:hypothetical protein